MSWAILNEGYGDQFVAFSPIFSETISQLDLYIPPVNDFDFYWTRASLTKDDRTFKSYSTTTDVMGLSQQINFTDWTFTIEDDTWRKSKIATNGDFDIVEARYYFQDSDASVGITWSFYMPKANLVEIPDIELPDEFYTGFNNMESVENLELQNIQLIEHPQINSYQDFVEFSLISNEDYDRFTYESLSGK